MNNTMKTINLKFDYTHLEAALIPYFMSLGWLEDFEGDIVEFDIPVVLDNEGLVDLEITYEEVE